MANGRGQDLIESTPPLVSGKRTQASEGWIFFFRLLAWALFVFVALAGGARPVAAARDHAAATGIPLREPDAIDALELGARRMDLIGLKFQLTDEMAASYAHALSLAGSKKKEDREDLSRDLNDINSVNGKIQDLRNTYSLLRDLYEQAWLKSNRPYFLRNNLERYDLTIQLWLSRSDKLRTAQRQYANTQTLPPASDLGLTTFGSIGEMEAVEAAEDAVPLAQRAGARLRDARLAEVVAHLRQRVRRRGDTPDHERQRGHEIDEPGKERPALQEVVVALDQ